MKVFTVLLLLPSLCLGQSEVESRVYHWGERIQDTTSIGTSIEMFAVTNDTHSSDHAADELIIVKEGKLRITVAGESTILGAGGVAYIQPAPDVKHKLEKVEQSPCKYIVIRAHHIVDLRGGNEKSVLINWDEMKFVPHDKGGRRNVIDMPTAFFKRFEMHITTLNPGLASHDPHSHTPEEMILIKEGNVEMNIGDKKVKASDGDLIFLESKISHNLTNIGSKATTYYAFQWEDF